MAGQLTPKHTGKFTQMKTSGMENTKIDYLNQRVSKSVFLYSNISICHFVTYSHKPLAAFVSGKKSDASQIPILIKYPFWNVQLRPTDIRFQVAITIFDVSILFMLAGVKLSVFDNVII